VSDPSFESWLNESTPALEAWGAFVVDKIIAFVKLEVGEDRFKSFFKIEPSYRAKEISSALKKQVKKNYPDPRVGMTDLVGARFVVLVRTDIEVVERALLAYSGWSTSRDRHFRDEVIDHPSLFDYQSVHYLVRATEETEVGGLRIPDGLPCEVQIRTLLQHAYAELVHDNIYKPTIQVPPSARRLVARSMALMETTDDMFCQALHELEQVSATIADLEQFAISLHTQICGKAADDVGSLEAMEFLETYRDLFVSCNRAELGAFLQGGYAQRIHDRSVRVGLFAKPISVLVYWLAREHEVELVERWNLPAYRRDLQLILADLGKATDSFY
jgi:putative GTP pyrophosphokinase